MPGGHRPRISTATFGAGLRDGEQTASGLRRAWTLGVTALVVLLGVTVSIVGGRHDSSAVDLPTPLMTSAMPPSVPFEAGEASDATPVEETPVETQPEPEGTGLTRFGYIRKVAVVEPVGQLHLEVHEALNQLLVVGPDDRVVKQIPVTGNPQIDKPRLTYVADRIEMSSDYNLEWQLPWFVRLAEGRGIGSHSVPLAVSDGSHAQRTSELGLPPEQGPKSHGCLRMHDSNARWIYNRIPSGTPVYWINGPTGPDASATDQ